MQKSNELLASVTYLSMEIDSAIHSLPPDAPQVSTHLFTSPLFDANHFFSATQDFHTL